MMTITGEALKRIGHELPPPSRSNFHLGGRDTLRDLLLESGFDQVRRWYHAMIADIEDGEGFVKMITSLRPELREIVDDEGTFAALCSTLSEITQQHLNQGEGIGLDALIVIARRG